MKLTIFYVKPRSHPFPILSWLIRLTQGTKYSHTASECEYASGVLDARSDGINLTPASEFFDHYKVVDTKEIVLNVTREEWVLWLHAQSHKEYAYWQNVGHLLKSLGRKGLNPWGKENTKLNCSELQALQISLDPRFAIGDSDEYDLLTLDDLIKKVEESC